MVYCATVAMAPLPKLLNYHQFSGEGSAQGLVCYSTVQDGDFGTRKYILWIFHLLTVQIFCYNTNSHDESYFFTSPVVRHQTDAAGSTKQLHCCFLDRFMEFPNLLCFSRLF